MKKPSKKKRNDVLICMDVCCFSTVGFQRLVYKQLNPFGMQLVWHHLTTLFVLYFFIEITSFPVSNVFTRLILKILCLVILCEKFSVLLPLVVVLIQFSDLLASFSWCKNLLVILPYSECLLFLLLLKPSLFKTHGVFLKLFSSCAAIVLPWFFFVSWCHKPTVPIVTASNFQHSLFSVLSDEFSCLCVCFWVDFVFISQRVPFLISLSSNKPTVNNPIWRERRTPNEQYDKKENKDKRHTTYCSEGKI